MIMNLTATLNASEQLSPSILSNYVTEAPVDGIIYGRQDKNWVPVAYKHYINMGANELMVMDAEALNLLEFKSIIGSSQTTATFDKTITSPNYIWFCSTKKISIIKDINSGFSVDTILQNEPITIDITDAYAVKRTFTFYCYRTIEELVANRWQFIITFDNSEGVA